MCRWKPSVLLSLFLFSAAAAKMLLISAPLRQIHLVFVIIIAIVWKMGIGEAILYKMPNFFFASDQVESRSTPLNAFIGQWTHENLEANCISTSQTTTNPLFLWYFSPLKKSYATMIAYMPSHTLLKIWGAVWHHV